MCLRGSAWLRAKLEATCTRQWQCKLYKSIMEILDPQAGPLLNAAYNVFSERAPDANRRFRRENCNCQKSVNSSVRLHIRKQIFNLRCWIDENFSHPQAINRSWFCRESFKQPQSVSCTAFAVSEKEEGFFFAVRVGSICPNGSASFTCQPTYVSSVFRAFVLEATSHSFTVQSADPDASNAPSQLKQQQDILNKNIFH